MNETSPSSGVSIESTMPFGWEVEHSLTPAGQESRRHTNIALLRALAALESLGAEYEHDKQEGMQKALDRVESKLDLVMLMVAGLMRAGANLPHEKAVTLHSDHVVWREHAENAPLPNQRLLLSLYLSPRLPQPLQLSATVSVVETLSGVVTISARFDKQDAESEEWLTRTIFRYHRRALQARRQP